MVQRVLLFDGLCNLCNGAVQFVLQHERTDSLMFASLQSDAGQRLLSALSVPRDLTLPNPSTLVLVDGRRVYTESEAVLQVVRHLCWPWSWIQWTAVIPRPLRDRMYRYVAAHRYDWFGRRTACMVPSPELTDRFLK